MKEFGPGSLRYVEKFLRSHGSFIHVRAEDIGYIRAEVPLDVIVPLSKRSDVADVNLGIFQSGLWELIGEELDTVFKGVRRTPRAADGMQIAKDVPRLAERLPLLTRNVVEKGYRYRPIDEIKADKLVEQFGKIDGRGTTVGIIEDMPDLSHPALQVARNLSGEIIPKVAGLLDPMWLLTAEGKARSDTSTFASVQYDTAVISGVERVRYRNTLVRLPKPGSWQLATWQRWSMIHNGRPPQSFLVAWQDTLEVWVDLNRNGDLADDAPLTNINFRFSTGHLPSDSAAGFPEDQTLVVAFDPCGLPSLYYAKSARGHSTMTAVTAVGSNFLGGSVGGVAPGARLISIAVYPSKFSWKRDVENLPAYFAEAVLTAARDPRIDVISVSYLSGLSFSALEFPAPLLERIARVYDKPIFFAAGNNANVKGLQAIVGSVANFGSGSVVPSIITVGAYISKRSVSIDDSIAVFSDNVASFSSRGPVMDGGMKPDVIAPFYMLTGTSCTEGITRYNGEYRLPRCYQMGGGTSNATPFAAGAAALLISAARLSNLPRIATTGTAIRWALQGSARHILHFGIQEQGAGLIQVDKAWSLLKKHFSSFRDPIEDIKVVGKVSGQYASYLENGIGYGILVIKPWDGSQKRREVGQLIVTRQSGPSGHKKYKLRWRGNDGTFLLKDSVVVLPLREAVQIDITAYPTHEGIFDAAVELVDATSGIVVRLMPVTSIFYK